jgi:hypothetical protein
MPIKPKVFSTLLALNSMDTPKKTQVRVLISVTPAFVFFKGLSRSSGKLFRFVLGSCTSGVNTARNSLRGIKSMHFFPRSEMG